MKAALASNVGKLVVLSTDKAVYPVNAMGMSKALMEKCMVAKARMYGEQLHHLLRNAIWQCNGIARLGDPAVSANRFFPTSPLTVTDPNMTRFMMTIEGAVDLVLYAFAHGCPRRHLCTKSSIGDDRHVSKGAAESLSELKMKFALIGTRHGEKLYETLLNREEMAHAEDLGDYYRVPADVRDLNYSRFLQYRKSRGFRSR